MGKKTLRFGVLIAVVFAGVCLLPATGKAQNHFFGGSEGSFDKTLNISGTLDLDVSTGAGSINIRNGSSNRLEIHGRIRAGDNWWWWSSRDSEDTIKRLEANPPIEQTGSIVRIGRNMEGFHNVSISYDIVLPAQTNVRSHSGSGSQTVEGVRGRVDVGTGSGSI